MDKSTILRDQIIIFTDGACSGNPGPGGWGAIIATPEGRISEMGGHFDSTTNNRMEMIATAKALEAVAKEKRELALFTDSVYVIRGTTEWVWGWKRRGWKTATGDDVANKDLWEWLSELASARRTEHKIHWHYVRGHIGTPGNERVDAIAVAFSKGKRIDLYQGTLLKYEVAIHDIPEDTSLPELKERKEKVAAHSYLSLVDGVLQRHATWPDCERRVKGRSGAKFKKAASESDEKEIIAGWGYDPSDIQ